jgi:hypothetical protein
MKNFYSLLAFLLISFNAQSQYFLQNNITYRSIMADSIIKKTGIAEITEVYTYIPKKGKTYTSKTIFQYDREGRATMSCTISDTLKMKHNRVYTMVNHSTNGNNGTSKSWRFGKSEGNSFIVYDAQENVKEYYVYNQRGRLSRSQEVFYKDSMRSRINTYNKRHQLQTYYLYEYNGKKIKSTGLYNSKGKIIRFWNYNCDDAGTMQKQKDTTTVCTSKTYLNDGTSISTTNYFNDKGEPVKSVYYTDSNGNPTKYLYYVGKEQALVYQSITTYINKQEASRFSKSFTRNGKEFSSDYKLFDAKHQIIGHLDTFWYSRKPSTSKKIYRYDDKGLLVESSGYSGDRLNSIYHYRYRYYLKKD